MISHGSDKIERHRQIIRDFGSYLPLTQHWQQVTLFRDREGHYQRAGIRKSQAYVFRRS